jgi:hypothetical protein
MDVPGKKAVDLAELGDEFIGYAPKAQKGQTVSSFEKEELQSHSHSAPSISYERFAATKYFSDSFNASVLDSSTAEKSDNVDSEQDTSAGGGSVPETSSFAERAVQPVIPLPKSEPPSDSVLSQSVVPLEKMVATVVFVDSKPTQLVQALSPVELVPFFTFDGKIGAFSTPLEARGEVLLLANKILSDYGGMLKGISTVVDPIYQDRKIPTPGKLGANLHDWINQLTTDKYNSTIDTVQLLDVRRSARVPGSTGIVNTDVASYVGTTEEADLIADLRAEEQYYLREIMEKWSFLRELDDVMEQLNPIPSTVDFQFNKVWHHPPLGAMNHMMDRSPVVSAVISDSIGGLVKTHIVSPAREEAKTMVEILNTLQVRTGNFNATNSFPSTLSGSAGSAFFRTLLQCTINSRYDKLSMDFSMHALTLEQLVGAVMMKLFAPQQAVHVDTQVDIDNYIVLHLANALPAKSFTWKNGRLPYPEEILQRQRNLMHEAINDGCFGSDQIGQAFEKCFGSAPGAGWGTGAGWAGTSTFSNVALPANSSVWMNSVAGRTHRYYPVFGSSANADPRPRGPNSIPEQFTYFTDFVRSLRSTTLAFSGADAKIGQGISALFSRITQFRDRVGAWNYYMDSILSRISLTSFVFPTSPLDSPFNTDGDVIPVNLKPISVNGPMSALFLIKWEEVKPLDINVAFLEHGWNMNRYFDELASMYHYVQDEFETTQATAFSTTTSGGLMSYTKSERVAKIFESMSATLSFSSFLKEKLGAVPTLYDFFANTFPDKQMIMFNNNPYVRKQKRALQYVIDNPTRFGYATHFYYGTSNVPAHPNFFRRGWQADLSAGAIRTISWNEWQNLLQKSQVRDLFIQAESSGTLIRFDFPIRFEAREITNEVQDSTAPISFTTSSNRVETQVLPYYFEWLDKFRRTGANELALDRPPRWLLDVTPFTFNEANNYTHLIHPVETYRFGFELFDAFSFMPRM